MTKPKPLLLIILDGFGVSLEKEGNPIFEAKTPVLDEIEKNFPFTTLQASGVAVGLPWGEAGNSEVGHLTIGAGKVLHHHLPRIISSIADESFFQNQALRKATEHVRQNHSKLHLAGLVSSGSVHSYIDHLYALFSFVQKEKLPHVYLHIFTDGKDAPPQEAVRFLGELENKIKQEWPEVSIASLIGRFYAMDRDEQWDRIEKAYTLLTQGKGKIITNVTNYLRSSYENEVTDEFIEPAYIETPADAKALVDKSAGGPAYITENDALIFFNFREDSMRELTKAFTETSFDKFPRKKISNLLVITMTEYQKGMEGTIPAFPALNISWPLARVIGEAGLRHLHIAETEKYAHITYFLNGGREIPFPGEERILIPSLVTEHPDQVPEMRASEITAKILENLDRYDLFLANFANADMVGHSGSFQAAVKAVEILDKSLGKIMNAVLTGNGAMIITADHGNIERKRSTISGEKLTEHSINPVPFYLVSQNYRLKKSRSAEDVNKQKSDVGGILTDIAPSIIEILGLNKPQEMTGKNLLDMVN